jgi:catechol 2,3-dioxygenase-like lactoylglutathione lyase family enzyme
MNDGLPATLHIVTLGVRDLAASIAFYEALGWERRGNPDDGIVWFKTSGSWIGLFGYDALAEDAGLQAPAELPAYRGVTLAVNLPSEGAVDAAFATAVAAGARVVKPAEKVFWGGYSGYFADPDGHLWELAHNPFFPLDDDGRIEIP